MPFLTEADLDPEGVQSGGRVVTEADLDPAPSFLDQIRGNETFQSNVIQPMRAVAQGATLGFADEAIAKLREMAGLGTYEQNLQSERQLQDQFSQDNPYTSAGLNLLGGVPLALATAPQAAATGIGRIWQAGKAGASMGAGYGFGSGEGGFTNRAIDATTGALIGGAGGAGVSGALESLGALARTRPVQNAWSQLTQNFGDEAGALFPETPIQAPLTEAEWILANRARGIPEQQLSSGLDELAGALADQQPMLPQEAINSAGLKRLARTVNNAEPSMDITQRALEARAGAMPDRVSTILDDITNRPTNAVDAGSDLIEKGQYLVENSEAGRTFRTSPIYKAAFQQGDDLSSPQLVELFAKDADLSAALNKTMKQVQFADENPYSLKVLDNVKKLIDQKTKTAVAKGEGVDAYRLTDLSNMLRNEIDAADKSGLYKQARAAFVTESKDVDALTSGPLRVILNLDKKTDSVLALKKLMTLEPTELRQLKETFGTEFESTLNKATRAYIEDVAASSRKDGTNVLRGIVDSPKSRQKLAALIGDEKVSEAVLKKLGREVKMAEGTLRYHEGASTAGNLAEEASIRNNMGTIRKLFNQPVETIIDQLSRSGMDDQTLQELARLLFTEPAAGGDALRRAMPVMNRFRTVDRVVGGLGQVGARDIAGQGSNLLDRR